MGGLKKSSDLFFEAGVLGNLTGRYLAERLINEKRAAFFVERKRSLGLRPSLVIGASPVIFDDLDIPSAFDEAVEFFLAKGVITKPQFKKLSADMRRRSFTLVADTRKHILERVKEMLAGFLTNGGTVQEFSKDMMGFFNQAGVTQQNPFYYDLVFQNNIQEALARGKDALYADADEDEFPLRQFLTVGDDRVRASHARLHEFTAPVNDPVWNTLQVPLDHGCRCSITLVHRDEGLKASPKKDAPDLDEKGFGFVK